MSLRAYLLAALLVTPALADEPASFDLKSESIKKIVQDAAARQSADARVADKPPAKAEPAAFKYMPPEKLEKPVREPPRQLPAPSSPANTFAAAMVDILVDELLDIEGDSIDASNEMLRCRVQKDIKISPPGRDNCPSVY